ncbi:YczI family protein [Lysinibacillus sp. SGAir0095]|uniref:YczI family protein n=1 Tax=Lysinibacillus sp. SGAir0095 TaxID=2070463 RepID=UPI0010CCB559|nr:YczI family protein [Lysinibacillus sp. SGAir0095]QCR31970.1 hypothetical protein C1N55_07200 [Lysinibacillus sp. SGAir0095]
MKIIRNTLAIIGFALSCYILLTREYGILPYMLILVGLMVLFTGIIEIRKKRKVSAIMSFISAGFSLFVGIYIF